MLITEQTELLQRRRAHHEAGHICCALSFGVPIIGATIVGERAYMLRDHYCAPSSGLGIEIMTTLCLCGPAAEEFFVGVFHDGCDQGDLAMAREVLARKYDALQIGAALKRYCDAADRLVTSSWGQARISLIATELLRRGHMTGEQIAALT
jgi:hypothetical protein